MKAAAAENYDELNDSSHLNLPSEASNEYGATMHQQINIYKKVFVIEEGTS